MTLLTLAAVYLSRKRREETPRETHVWALATANFPYARGMHPSILVVDRFGFGKYESSKADYADPIYPWNAGSIDRSISTQAFPPTIHSRRHAYHAPLRGDLLPAGVHHDDADGGEAAGGAGGHGALADPQRVVQRELGEGRHPVDCCGLWAGG